MHRTLAISQKTLFLSKKVKIDFNWLSISHLKNFFHKRRIGGNHVCAASFSHFGRFWAFATHLAFWVIFEVKCNEYLLYLRKCCFWARKSKSTWNGFLFPNCKIPSRKADFAKITYARPVVVILAEIKRYQTNSQFGSLRRWNASNACYISENAVFEAESQNWLKMPSLGQIAKSLPEGSIWQTSSIRGLFWSFGRIFSVCHQPCVLGHLGG